MPYINVSTSAKIEDKKKFLEEISILVSSLTNKSKQFVMAYGVLYVVFRFLQKDCHIHLYHCLFFSLPPDD